MSNSNYETTFDILKSPNGDVLEFVFRSKDDNSFTSYSHDCNGNCIGIGIDRPDKKRIDTLEEAYAEQIKILEKKESELLEDLKKKMMLLQSISYFIEDISQKMKK